MKLYDFNMPISIAFFSNLRSGLWLNIHNLLMLFISISYDKHFGYTCMISKWVVIFKSVELLIP